MTQLATQSLEMYFQTVGDEREEHGWLDCGFFLFASEWKIYKRLSVNNVESFPMEFKKKPIIGKKFMPCYSSEWNEKSWIGFLKVNWWDRKLVVPGDLRSYGGGNGLPRGVKQSPDFSRIIEEDEEEEEEENEKPNDVSMILVRYLSENDLSPYSFSFFFSKHEL